MFLDICKDFFRTISLIAEQVASCNVCHVHKFNGVGRIIIIAGRQQKSDRIPQLINNDMDFCVYTVLKLRKCIHKGKEVW